MKRVAFKAVAVAILTTGATAAFAGDTDAPIITTTPPAPTTPAFVPARGNDWTGFYAGGSLGYADVTEDSDVFDDDGFTYGIHGGYDYDFGTFVLGGEVEISGFDISGAGTDVDSVSRLKVRAGYDAGDFLPYFTTGIAQLDTSGGLSGDDTGAFYGVGLDYAFTDDIRIGGEILEHEFDNFDGSDLDFDATTVSLRIAYEF